MAMIFALLITVPVSAQGRQLRQHHSIEIEVECLETATEIIRGLNGYNLESSVFLHESPHDRGAWRSASFVRRVDYWAFAHVQDVLRGMGEVHFETENAQFLGAQIMDLDARLAALTQEIERLSIMMAASDSLDVLIAIDVRLSQVTWERNNVIGTRNMLLAQVASPVINIWINEAMGERPEPARAGFGSRVVDSFMDSLSATGTVAGNFLVFIARVFIPFMVYAVLALILIWVCIAVRRRRAARPMLAVAGTPLESTEEWATVSDEAGTAKEVETPHEPTMADNKEGEQ